ncbi:hypothetical protein PBAL39_15264 [Pedobacter sp. BAL39]|uniref:hypothetical protein n=1 Tax=Pedobacter sp. BAL39 TaxID=391596 RepID=UPI0001559BAD|nr:hypothetical protein [Pedobacter sp. BAL39]EDM37796.1 hypothetical protein PBAL39_15264 [Pedobacter sp. BAL39]
MTTFIQGIEPKKTLVSNHVGRRMLVCAIIGLVLIGYFIISAGEGNPGWSKYWRIKPLVLTPVLCAITGLCYDITGRLREIPGWKGKLFFALSVIGLIAGFWMSMILGLNGTMWD